MQVEVLSPSRILAKVTASGLQVPGYLGQLGILPGHAPMITELGVGILRVDKADKSPPLHFFIAGGYLEISNDHAKVLVDVVEKPEEIDRARVEQARARAMGRLTDTKSDIIDLGRARKALQRADARLAFLENIANVKMR